MAQALPGMAGRIMKLLSRSNAAQGSKTEPEDTGLFLQHVANLMTRQSDQVLQEQLGIGISQFRVLQALVDNPHIQQRQIGVLLGQTEASISRQVKLLYGKQMINTIINPDNRREHLTTLTLKGQRVVEASAEALARYHAPAFKELSGKQQSELRKLLQGLHVGLCRLDNRTV